MTGKAVKATHRAVRAAQRGRRHLRGLVLIGVLELLKGTLLLALGFGLLKLLHHDLYAMTMQLVGTLRFDPNNTFINTLLGEVSMMNDHRLWEWSAFTFACAALYFLEGIGLVLEKAWGEYVTLAVTALFLPVEVLKTMPHPTWWKLLLILANLVIVLYLAWVLRKNNAKTRLRSA